MIMGDFNILIYKLVFKIVIMTNQNNFTSYLIQNP